jgi:hypothetical protein
VARAFAEALTRDDGPTLTSLIVPDKGVLFFIRQALRELRQGPEAGMLAERTLSEWALLPAGLAGAGTLGPRQGEGDEAVFEVQWDIQLAPKLVVRKQADGTHAVDLRASLVATAAPRPSMFDTMIGAMGSQTEAVATAHTEEPERQPWECQNRLREIASALDTYAAEHGNKYPLAAVWMDALQPYLTGEHPYQCPLHTDEEYSYAFNGALSEQTRPTDWDARRRTLVVACVGGDEPNALIDEAAMAKIKPRHGKLQVIGSATGEAVMLPAGMTPHELWQRDAQTEQCSQRLNRLVDAARAYAKAHDGRLPEAATWTDDLEPLVAKPNDGASAFACPAVRDADCTYAINPALAGKNMKDLVNWRRLVLFVETGACPRNHALAEDTPGLGRHLRMWDGTGRLYLHRAYLNGAVGNAPGLAEVMD